MIIRGQVILPKRAKPQPQPHLSAGGDCGFCVLAGLLACSVEEAYALVKREPKDGSNWHEMRKILYDCHAHGVLDRIIVETPSWRGAAIDSQAYWGSPSWSQALEWFAYVRMALDAGYYGIAVVNHAKKGPNSPPDHFVMICGAREVWPPADEGGAIHKEVLISCSSASTPDEEWVDARDFLKMRGGFNLFLARPA